MERFPQTGPEKLHELSHHSAFAQHLRDGEHEVGRGHTFLKLAGQPHADHFRQQHGIGLAEHRRFRLDAAHAPTEHRESVDHRGMRIGPDQRVGIRDIDRQRLAVDLDLVLFGPDGLGEVFQIDLVANAGARRHDTEIVERFLRPFEELVALAILSVLLLDVLLQCRAGAVEVDRYRMVADQIDRDQRIDLPGITAQHLHGIAHGSEIHHRRDAGKVLHQHPRRAEGDLALRRLGLEPLSDRLQILLGDGTAILVAQQVLEQDLHGERQTGNPLESILLGHRQAEKGVGLAAHREGFAAAETVE